MDSGVLDKLKSKKSRSKTDIGQVRNFGLSAILKHCVIINNCNIKCKTL